MVLMVFQKALCSAFPVTTENGEYKIVQGLEIDEFSRERINFTLNELEEERAADCLRHVEIIYLFDKLKKHSF